MYTPILDLSIINIELLIFNVITFGIELGFGAWFVYYLIRG